MRRLVPLVLLLCSAIGGAEAGHAAPAEGQAGRSPWTSVSAPAGRAADAPASARAHVARLDVAQMLDLLAQAPIESLLPSGASAQADTPDPAPPLVLDLPWPDGTFHRFRAEESPIMEPGLAAKFPEIRTYTLQGVEDTSASGRAGWSTLGFHALVFSATGTTLIAPQSQGDLQTYESLYQGDRRSSGAPPPPCGNDDSSEVTGRDRDGSAAQGVLAAGDGGAASRRYRLAVATTGEWWLDQPFFARDKGSAIGKISRIVNQIDAILWRDTRVRLVLVSENDQLVFTDPSTDPYPDGSNARDMLSRNTAVLSLLIGRDSYDIGHVFSPQPTSASARCLRSATPTRRAAAYRSAWTHPTSAARAISTSCTPPTR